MNKLNKDRQNIHLVDTRAPWTVAQWQPFYQQVSFKDKMASKRNDKCEPLGYRDQCNGNLQDHPHPLPSSSSCSPFWKIVVNVYQFFSMSVFWYKNDLKCCYTCNLIFRMLIFGIFYTHGMKIFGFRGDEISWKIWRWQGNIMIFFAMTRDWLEQIR